MSKKNTKRKQSKTPHLRVVSRTEDIVRPALLQTVLGLGLEQVYAIVEEERTRLCGERYARVPERTATRAGTAPGELVLGGRRVALRRPRVRTLDGQEVALESWQHFADEDPLDERAMEQMAVGVATRKYERSLEKPGKAVKTRGASKSAVSRRFVNGTHKRLKELMGRDLSELQLAALMLDGLHVGEHVVLIAMGIDEDGNKHVLGIHEGATENAAACTGLLGDLRDRGLNTERSILVVIDGSKALHKAVRDIFGERAMIQRCQEHKVRNVTGHLPKDMQLNVRRSMKDAYRCGKKSTAKKMLNNLMRTLAANHPSAASSLEEGLDETLTVIGLGLPRWLERTLATTNSLENLNGHIRQTTRNVKRWRDGTMVLRWIAAAVHEAQKTFRKVRGYKGMPRLINALRDHDATLEDALVEEAVVA